MDIVLFGVFLFTNEMIRGREMTFMTVYNQPVQVFMEKNKDKNYRSIKYTMLRTFKEILVSIGKLYEKCFPRVKSKIVECIFFLTSGAGIWKISAEAIAKKLECSISSVYNTVNELKKTGVFVIARLANNGAGKYVFVNKLHYNFKKIMQEVFNLSEEEIDETIVVKKEETLEDCKNKGQQSSEKPGHARGESRYFAPYLFESLLKQEKICISDIKDPKLKEVQDRPKSFEEQKEALMTFGADTQQMLLFETIHSWPYPQSIKDQGYKLVLRADSDLSTEAFHRAKDAVHEVAMRITDEVMDVKSVPGLFQSIFNNSLVQNLQQKNSCQKFIQKSRKRLPFYNWLIERADDIL